MHTNGKDFFQDYPSLALITEKMSENNINLIFAVTSHVESLYKVKRVINVIISQYGKCHTEYVFLRSLSNIYCILLSLSLSIVELQ